MIGYLWSWLQYSIIIICSFLYPLYRSSRIFKKKENPANLQVLLKYWVIYAILYFVDTYLHILITSFITFYDFLQLVLYIALIVDNFRLSVTVYDYLIHSFFSFNEGVIDSYLKIMNDHIADSRDKAVQSSRSYVTKFLRETVLPTISRLIFQNPQEPEVPQKPAKKSGHKRSTANPVDEDAGD